MAFLTINELDQREFTKAFSLNESLGAKDYDKKLFLSYRRKDKKYVKPIVELLTKLGARIYIDYIDDTLPDKPNNLTAAILRDRIKGSDKFILLATPNASESKWIPWELGLGDGAIKYENVAILPVTRNSNNWDEQEYFEIYGYIEKANSKNKSKYDYAIRYPDGTAIWLDKWIKN
jgi:hypothetical protein